MDTLVCMGAAIGVGLGMRHVLPPEEARRVVSVIGDSTFVHSGLTGLAEMVYNPPATGHVLLILDNGTTAMTGMQEHPGTGRTLDHHATGKIVFEDVARAMGIRNVHVIDPSSRSQRADALVVVESLAKPELTVIIARRNCLLAAGSIKAYERASRTAANWRSAYERGRSTSSSPAWADRACSRPRTSWPTPRSAPDSTSRRPKYTA